MTARPNMPAPTVQSFDGTKAYIDLLKHCLNGLTPPSGSFAVARRPDETVVVPVTPETMAELMRRRGPWPATGFTMMGLDRTDNLQACVEDVLANDVPGDMIETGVWRGGATILMRALLEVYGVTDRTVVVADSFEGVPPPDEEAFPLDAGSRLYEWDHLAVPVELVKDNFARFGLLDDQVEFVRGRFRDTLPTLSDRVWSVVRLDGDLYESTINALEELYPNLSPGGYLIVDDYGALGRCRTAVHDYRDAHGIEQEIRKIDWSGVFWQKEA
jgi:O-methyltransferase